MRPQEHFNNQGPPPFDFTTPPADDDARPEGAGQTTAPPRRAAVLALYEGGTTDVAEIVRVTGARPYFVAKVLQRAGHLAGYFDLFTPTAREQNVYARFFRRVLRIGSAEAARESVTRIDRLYDYFGRLGDRAGQHHAQLVALTGQNRARASRRDDVAQVFHDWLAAH